MSKFTDLIREKYGKAARVEEIFNNGDGTKIGDRSIFLVDKGNKLEIVGVLQINEDHFEIENTKEIDASDAFSAALNVGKAIRQGHPTSDEYENNKRFIEQECPKCGENELKYNQEWDEEFDRLDRSYPDYDQIRRQLKSQRIPKYVCSNCRFEKYE